MKKAVIATGGRQYIVSEGDEIEVNLLPEAKTMSFDAMLVIDGDNVSVGAPLVDKVKVNVDVVEASLKGDKVTSIRFKAKKRVHKVRGHRQALTRLKVTSIK